MGAGAGSHNAKLATVARARGLRIVGPNCLGVIAPHANLFASFAAHRPLPGDLALLSQSGAVSPGVVGWARSRPIGSLGRGSGGGRGGTSWVRQGVDSCGNRK